LNKYIQYIEEQEISFCLKKTSLLITDFSSIIFDIIYRKKPFIIYIPDADDPDLKNIYDKNYYELIDSLKNGTLYFENIFFDLKRTINNIIYYINNNFKLDQKLEYFYNSFNLKKEMAINKFIDILKK
jgi:CDP-glycerol glycerophosphotransferase (TagB/SpsB family)